MSRSFDAGRPEPKSAAVHADHGSLEAPWLVLGDTLLGYFRSATEDGSHSYRQQIQAVAGRWRAAGKLGAEGLPEEHAPSRGVYMDVGQSGWTPAFDQRTAASELLAYCRAHPQPEACPGVITVSDLSRLGRFPQGSIEALQWLDVFANLGWRFCSLEEGDLSTPRMSLLIQILTFARDSEKDWAASDAKSRRDRRERIRAEEGQLRAPRR